MTPNEATALARAISPDRLAPFTAAAATTGATGVELYLWDRDLAVAYLADIAVLEVTLRNALHDRLTTTFGGADWYVRAVSIGLDPRSCADIRKAITKLPGAAVTPGRVVAQLMFGFWVGLLDTGASTHNYENKLWRPTLSRAFPGGRVEAGSAFTRTWTHNVVSTVHAFRNRAAHHESFLTGVPLRGQFDTTGNPIRVRSTDGHAACLQLARLLDRDIATWLTTNSAVPTILGARP